MKKIALFAVLMAASVAVAGPDINWGSEYALTGIGAPDLQDRFNNPIPTTADWAVELIRADTLAVLHTVLLVDGFWSAAATPGVGFAIIQGTTPGMDSWNGLSVMTRVWETATPGNPLTDWYGLSTPSTLAWSLAPLPASVDLQISEPLTWVPEPGTGLLVLAGAAVAIFRRRRAEA
jgi:hypothetical protein